MQCTATYDSENIFAKILRKEIPCNLIYENDFILAFHDIFPRAAIHALVIPKGEYLNAHDFHMNATSDTIASFYKALSFVTEMLDMQSDGYRLTSNTGIYGRQEVPHYHVHVMGGSLLES